MANDMIIQEKATPIVGKNHRSMTVNKPHSSAMYDQERTGKLMDEAIGGIKDLRLNTKHALSADNAATARVQNQNDRAIAVYERELRRKDLSPERRDQLVDYIAEARQSSATVCSQSRAFQSKYLDKTGKIIGWVIGGALLLVGGGIGGAALLRARA